VSNALVHATSANNDSGTPLIDIRLTREGDQAVIQIQDYGPGIPPEIMPYLFDRFHRFAAAEADRPTSPGMGLGLYIAREIAISHGGTIDADSAAGQGATFTIRLPLAPEATKPPARSRRKARSSK
jgi:signal transduction histidine kinase